MAGAAVIMMEPDTIRTVRVGCKSKWETKATRSSWVPCGGVHVSILVPEGCRAALKIDGYGHGSAMAAGRRLDVAVFDNGAPKGVVDDHEYGEFRPGMALSHTPTWVPIVAAASFDAGSGLHVLELRIRNGDNNGEVGFNGSAMVVQVHTTGAPRAASGAGATAAGGEFAKAPKLVMHA